MKKILTVLAVCLFVVTFGLSAQAQTLDQYKAQQNAKPTLDQLVRSASLRSSLEKSDLQIVYDYCQKYAVGYQQTADFEAAKNASNERGVISYSERDIQNNRDNAVEYQKDCPIIKSELEAKATTTTPSSAGTTITPQPQAAKSGILTSAKNSAQSEVAQQPVQPVETHSYLALVLGMIAIAEGLVIAGLLVNRRK